MKIFDCFMFYDEEMLLDIRLNILNKFVDQFVIVESTFTHSGQKRNLVFDLQKYKKFKDKIKYYVVEKKPDMVETINSYDTDHVKENKTIMNAVWFENSQRNAINNLLGSADANDQIIISDVDEIPNLESIDIKNLNNKIILFEQAIFYYKLNRYLPNFKWYGTKACKKKHLESPQWLRNIKNKKYSFFRLDTLFSKSKYIDKYYIKNGGWHFSNLKNSKDIEIKLKSYLHHRDYESEELGIEKIKELIKENKTIYDMYGDKGSKKYGDNSRKKLEKFEINKLPLYIQNNLEKFKEWID